MSDIDTSLPNSASPAADSTTPSNFIRAVIDEDLKNGKTGGKVITRFPPEPNGYLHIGHAKAICINFGIARDYEGVCNLRFDDTNPAKEDVEYVESIIEDIKWLGFDPSERIFYGSDYFGKMHEYAVDLIRAGKAYVCELTPEQIREYRGTLTEPGRESPFRNRGIDENLDLFARMTAGEFPDGSKTLRAKIDMAHPNLNMRDPVMYRILQAHHHRTGDKWCVYPMYDWAHGLEDAIEGITHSLCSLEFEDHRPLYDWFLDQLKVPCHPQQIEFARLNLTRTVMSKRKLLELVKRGLVDGWDDPRMPTLTGFRRKGYTSAAIRDFCERIGVAKRNSIVDIGMLEYCLRQDLNASARRAMAVLEPLKVVIENYPEGQVEWFDAENNPENPSAGTRKVPFSREIFIERDDFMENPPKKFFRLSPGSEIRLKHAYYITCTGFVKDEAGEVTEIRCQYDPESRGGGTPDGRKVKGTSHWVSAPHSIPAEVRVYDHLFKDFEAEGIPADAPLEETINPGSLAILGNCRVEPSLAQAVAGDTFQFLRQGYFCVDSRNSKPGKPVFNRAVSLKDTWGKITTRDGGIS